MDDTNLPRLDLSPRKKQPRTSKHGSQPQLHLKQSQSASQRTLPRSSTSSQNYAPGYQKQERHQPAQGQSRLGKRLVKDTQTGDYRQTRDYVDVPQASRRQGLYIIGATGTGKSGLIENLIVQDIKQGVGVCVLDPHGDLINAVLSRMDRREDDVILLDITDYHYPFGINLFACSDPTNPLKVQGIVDQVFHVFEKLLGVTQETQLILEYLYNCTSTLIANPGYTMADIPLLLQDETCRRKLVANVTDSDVLGFWKHHDQKKPNDQNNDIASTLRRVRRFLQPLSRNIVGQSTSTIDLQRIMDEGKILLVKLSAQYQSISNLIGSILVALILNAAYARPANKRRQFNLYADEFQRFATEDFATLLTEARKFGIATTIAHQARFQPGMTDGIRATTLGAANLVVFRVQPEDATELAGRFDITPQEAWEEEIEKEWEEELEEEWVEIVSPQRHERIEEQVAVEVEEDVKAIINNPIEYLLSVRSAHSSERVTEIIQNPLKKLKEKLEFGSSSDTIRRVQKLFSLLNDLLIQVMWGNILIESSLFIKKVLEIARAYNPNDTWEEPEWEGLLINLFAQPELRETIIETYALNITIEHLKEQHKYEQYKEVLEICGERFNVNSSMKKYIILIEAVRDLCVELEKSPITISTGEKKMVKRIQPHITYLTHESEKITHPRVAIMHPRKTISHPQRTYADVHNEVASQLTNLPVFTARVKITSDNGSEEHTIRTLDPKKDSDRPLFGQALQDRIDSIKKQNIQDGYMKERATVEAEIRTRQGQCSQPPPEEPPISRLPNR